MRPDWVFMLDEIGRIQWRYAAFGNIIKVINLMRTGRGVRLPARPPDA